MPALDFVVDVANPDISVISHGAVVLYSNIIARLQSDPIFDVMESAIELRSSNPQHGCHTARRVARSAPDDAGHSPLLGDAWQSLSSQSDWKRNGDGKETEMTNMPARYGNNKHRVF